MLTAFSVVVEKALGYLVEKRMRFGMAEDEHPHCTFNGFQLRKGSYGTVEIDEKEY